MPAISAVPTEQPLSVKRLTAGSKRVRRVIFLDEPNHVLVADFDGNVRVWDTESTGEPCAVFKAPTSCVNDIALLDNGVVASVGPGNALFTWRAVGGELVGKWENTADLKCIAKLGKLKCVVGDSNGDVTVLIHNKSASRFRVQRRFDYHRGPVFDITVYANHFVSSSNGKIYPCTRLWRAKPLEHICGFDDNGSMSSAALNDRYFVTSDDGPWRPGLYVGVHSGDVYKSLIDFPEPERNASIRKVAFLKDDIITFALRDFLYFTSIPTKSILSRVKMDEPVSWFNVANDGRIAVVGDSGSCAIVTPPKSVQGTVDDRVAPLNQSSSVEHATIQGAVSTESVPEVNSSSGIIATVSNASKSEMVRWKMKGVSKNSVQQLDSSNVAACLVAFLLNYETDSEEMFCKLKETMKKVFKKKRIYGASFVEADEVVKKELLDVLVVALKDATDEDAKELTKMLVKKFIRLATAEV